MSAGAFVPARWAAGRHAQTLVARFLRSGDGPDFERERVETPDGDFLDVDWCPEPEPDAPLALVVHGLEGSARRRYVRNVARELLRRGVRPVALNLRGCSGEPNRLPRFYHSGDTGDVAQILELIRRRHPGRPVGAMGFSLGGNLLVKLLGEREDGGTGIVDAAAVMSVPYDLAACCRLLERTPMGRMYARYFLRSLTAKVELKRDRLRDLIDVDAAVRAATVWRFDDLVTAPLNGFADAAEYYGRSSSGPFVPAVRTPTLLLHAVDDPFLPAAAIPEREARENPAITPSLHERGGHVGFLSGSLRRPVFWADERAADFLARRLRG